MNIGNRTAYYGRECFVFMHNFIRIVIPFEKDENDTINVVENDRKFKKWPEKWPETSDYF
ncbi:MAG: hypothetical protein J6T56_03580 [Bacteroidales bacterium]|nr:hypothetical protein [Bacteroidales bacterium]MBP5612551.1 hypothetical protein [Bacteroidales bacterium]